MLWEKRVRTDEKSFLFLAVICYKYQVEHDKDAVLATHSIVRGSNHE